MGIAALLVPLIPGLIDSLMAIIRAVQSDPAKTAAQKAAVKVQIAKLYHDLGPVVQEVLDAPDVL